MEDSNDAGIGSLTKMEPVVDATDSDSCNNNNDEEPKGSGNKKSGDEPRPDGYQHTCAVCDKTFQSGSNLNRHIRKIHKSEVARLSSTVRCCICGCDCISSKALTSHLQDDHHIVLQTEKLHFSSERDFLNWKSEIERSTTSLFVKNSGSKRKGDTVLSYYSCHRSGYFQSRGTGKRRLKSQGSNKVNGTCPAHMKVTQGASSVEVVFLKTHVGHSCELARLRLTQEDKITVATQLAQNLTPTEILNNVQTSAETAGERLERLHLLKRKDVLNIKKRINLSMSESDDSSHATMCESMLPTGHHGDHHCDDAGPSGADAMECVSLAEGSAMGSKTSGEVTVVARYTAIQHNGILYLVVSNDENDNAAAIAAATAAEKQKLEDAKTRLRQMIESVSESIENCQTLEECDKLTQILSQVSNLKRTNPNQCESLISALTNSTQVASEAVTPGLMTLPEVVGQVVPISQPQHHEPEVPTLGRALNVPQAKKVVLHIPQALNTATQTRKKGVNDNSSSVVVGGSTNVVMDCSTSSDETEKLACSLILKSLAGETNLEFS